MMNVFKLIAADYNRYKTSGGKNVVKMIINPGFIAVCIFRINRSIYYLLRKIPIIGFIYAIISYVILKFNQIVFGISFPEDLTLGKGVFISHLGTIIMNGKVKIGENCNLAPMVVIGWGYADGKAGTPVIGDRVWIGPGAKIFGPITIGDDVAIGANAVVNFDVPSKATVVGPKSRIIEDKGSNRYIKY